MPMSARAPKDHLGLRTVQRTMTRALTTPVMKGMPSGARGPVRVGRYGPRMEIRRVGPGDWESFRAVRLASLSESPAAFGSRYADWVEAPAERWLSRLTQVPLTLLACEATEVVGVVSGQRVGEDWVELISMWVAPAARGDGVARELIDAVTRWAAEQGRRTYLMDTASHGHLSVCAGRRRRAR
jgi:GNAT superfamily N-acetyltransferase